MSTKSSKNNSIDIFADMYENPAFMGNTLLQDDVKLFQITFDWNSDGEGGGEFKIRTFRLFTGIKTIYRNREIEMIIDMPKESHDYAEKLLWRKMAQDGNFIEDLEHPEHAVCGHDLSLA